MIAEVPSRSFQYWHFWKAYGSALMAVSFVIINPVSNNCSLTKKRVMLKHECAACSGSLGKYLK
jgi:hypothetical protein